MMKKIAHGIDIELCEDKSCRLVHVVLYDENHDAFAEAVIEPTPEWQNDFVRVLLQVCDIARERQRQAVTPPVAH